MPFPRSHREVFMFSKLLATSIVVLVSALTLGVADAEVIQTKNCKLGSMRATISTDSAVAPSTGNHRPMPGTAVNFVQGSSSNCVLIQFSGEFETDGDILISGSVTNVGFAKPGVVTLGRDNRVAGRSFNFVITNVPPGPHKASSNGSEPAERLVSSARAVQSCNTHLSLLSGCSSAASLTIAHLFS